MFQKNRVCIKIAETASEKQGGGVRVYGREKERSAERHVAE